MRRSLLGARLQRAAGNAEQHQGVVIVGGVDGAGRVFDAVVAAQDETEVGRQRIASAAVAVAAVGEVAGDLQAALITAPISGELAATLLSTTRKAARTLASEASRSSLNDPGTSILTV